MKLTVLVWLIYVNSVMGSAPWQDRRSNVLQESLYADLPPNTFAPDGRLLMVEKILPLTQSLSDTSASLSITIECESSVVVVTSLPRSPYTNTTTVEPWARPFGRLADRLLAVTGGNAVDSQIVRTILFEIAASDRAAGIDPTAASIARQLADRFQLRTMQSGQGRMLASTVTLTDGRDVWRVDPTGQFYRCRAAVGGRGAVEAEAKLLTKLQETAGEANEPLRASQVQGVLRKLTDHEAVALAARVIRETLANKDDATRVPLLACVCSPNKLHWYSTEELESTLTEKIS